MSLPFFEIPSICLNTQTFNNHSNICRVLSATIYSWKKKKKFEILHEKATVSVNFTQHKGMKNLFFRWGESFHVLKRIQQAVQVVPHCVQPSSPEALGRFRKTTGAVGGTSQAGQVQMCQHCWQSELREGGKQRGWQLASLQGCAACTCPPH